MPKATYENLSEAKKAAVLSALVAEFERHPLSEATVKSIVEALGISRGSFYQYFDSLTESYFYVLEREIVETHALFRKVYEASGQDLLNALEGYGEALAEEIFSSRHHALYRNRFLYWNARLDAEWRNYLKKRQEDLQEVSALDQSEVLRFIRAVVHALMQRLFTESWSHEEFLSHYRQQLEWIKGGIENHVSSHGTLI